MLNMFAVCDTLTFLKEVFISMDKCSRLSLSSLVRAEIASEEMKSLATNRSVGSARAEIPVVTLNIGGRNTNPLEFILEGDTSEIGQQVVQMNLRAQEAVVDAVYGPAAMPDVERALVNKILTSIYGESS